MKHLVDNNFNTNKLQNVPTPVNSGDAVNKEYSDTKVAKDELVINVKDYGATGNGSTNDTAAVQAAIDALPADGGTVFVPAGTYIVNMLTISSNTTLRGEGSGSLLKAPSGNNNPVVTNDTHVGGNSGISILNIAIDGNRANQTSSYSTLWLNNVSDVLVEGCRVSGGKRAVQGGPNGEGIELKGCQYGRISNNYALDNDYDGIKIRDSSADITITGNVCINNQAGGIQAYLSERIAITGNTITSADSISTYSAWFRGITLHTVTHSTVSGNTITGPGKSETLGVGLMLLESSDYNTYTGNYVTGMYRGIMFNNTRTPKCSYNSFEGVHIRECEIAIDLMARALNNTFTNIYAETCVTFVRSELDSGESDFNLFTGSKLVYISGDVHDRNGTTNTTSFVNTYRYTDANGWYETRPINSSLQNGVIGLSQRTTTSSTTTTTAILIDSVDVTVPYNRTVRVTWEGLIRGTAAGARARVDLRLNGTTITLRDVHIGVAGGAFGHYASRVLELAAGSHTITAYMKREAGTGDIDCLAGPTYPTELAVIDLGPRGW